MWTLNVRRSLVTLLTSRLFLLVMARLLSVSSLRLGFDL